MAQNLISSAPGIFSALLGLVQTAAATQSPKVAVFPFELSQYEPGSYVTVHAIENHSFEWETIGSFSQKEHYDVVGVATVFNGGSVVEQPTIGTDVMTQTYSLFQACVMGPVMSNRLMPILGTTGPTPFQVLPGFARYRAGPGNIGGAQGGWAGVIEWSYHFDAFITPA